MRPQTFLLEGYLVIFRAEKREAEYSCVLGIRFPWPAGGDGDGVRASCVANIEDKKEKKKRGKRKETEEREEEKEKREERVATIKRCQFDRHAPAFYLRHDDRLGDDVVLSYLLRSGRNYPSKSHCDGDL